MKKVILALALSGLTSTGLLAQAPGLHQKNTTPAEQAKRNTEQATKDLGLNNDQKVKWEAAALERINANLPLREKMKGSTTPEERRNIREQTKVNNQKFEQTVTAFLTPDQKTKLDKMKEERKARRNKHRRAQGFGPSERGMDNVQQSPSPN